MNRRTASIALGLALLIAPSARADIDPLSGIDFVRVGNPGNAPWAGDGFSSDMAIGRGQVNYQYSMGRLEVTTAQWAEFFNAYYDRALPVGTPYIPPSPAVWGAVPTTPNNPGGARWRVPAGNESIPVGGISWRTAAIYCNWLSNGKSLAAGAFMNGAYDVSTFHDVGNGFTDQITHNANAQYWIPTWDEYLKAAHFDPNKNGPGQGGYWVADYMLSQFAIPGPPGVGQANYGFTSPSPFVIPLGSYPSVQSAYGLLDLAGGTSEWTEYTLTDLGTNFARYYEGSYWGSPTNAAIGDTIYGPMGGDLPGYRDYGVGFRIASSVPAPASGLLPVGVLLGNFARRRKRHRSCGTHSRR